MGKWRLELALHNPAFCPCAFFACQPYLFTFTSLPSEPGDPLPTPSELPELLVVMLSPFPTHRPFPPRPMVSARAWPTLQMTVHPPAHQNPSSAWLQLPLPLIGPRLRDAAKREEGGVTGWESRWQKRRTSREKQGRDGALVPQQRSGEGQAGATRAATTGHRADPGMTGGWTPLPRSSSSLPACWCSPSRGSIEGARGVQACFCTLQNCACFYTHTHTTHTKPEVAAAHVSESWKTEGWGEMEAEQRGGSGRAPGADATANAGLRKGWNWTLPGWEIPAGCA